MIFNSNITIDNQFYINQLEITELVYNYIIVFFKLLYKKILC